VSYFSMCVTVLIGFALIGVGMSVVRRADARSGYLFAAAGGVIVLTHCCIGFTAPDSLVAAGVEDIDVVSSFMIADGLAGIVESLVVGALLAFALVGLAKKVPPA